MENTIIRELEICIRNKDIKKMESLLDQGMDPNTVIDNDGNTLLHYAASSGQTEIVELLLRYRANINARNNNGDTPLHKAVYEQRENIVRILLERGARIVVNKNKKTPLHMAATGRNVDIVELLLMHGANPNIQDSHGNTPLLNATGMHGREKIIKLMLEYGAMVNIPNKDENTPIHYAAFYGNRNIMELLLNKNKEQTKQVINEKNKDGLTPLCMAALIFENKYTIVPLLENGASPVIPNRDGEMPLDTQTVQQAIQEIREKTKKEAFEREQNQQQAIPSNLPPLTTQIKPVIIIPEKSQIPKKSHLPRLQKPQVQQAKQTTTRGQSILPRLTGANEHMDSIPSRKNVGYNIH